MPSVYRSRVLVLAGLFVFWAQTQLWAQRSVLDPGRLQNQILWTAAEEAKLEALGKVESSHRDILSKETAWQKAVGPSVANDTPANPVAPPASRPSTAAVLLAKLAGSDTPYGAYANADANWRGAMAVLDAKARTFAGDGRSLDSSDWQQLQQQSTAQANQVLLVTGTRNDEATRAKTLLTVQVTKLRADAADGARDKNILRADFPP